jgi:hypothetical protein
MEKPHPVQLPDNLWVELLGNHPIAVREFWMFRGQSEENIASNVLTDRLKCLLVLVCCRRRAIPPRGR